MAKEQKVSEWERMENRVTELEEKMEKVWQKYEAQHGPVNGNLRSLAEAALVLGLDK